jgi:Na+-driven multidrug efflux pump
MFASLDLSILFSMRKQLVKMFTYQEELRQLTSTLAWGMILFHGMDFLQGVQCGIIKALNRQKYAAYINFVTYYVIIVPLAYFMCFYK